MRPFRLGDDMRSERFLKYCRHFEDKLRDFLRRQRLRRKTRLLRIKTRNALLENSRPLRRDGRVATRTATDRPRFSASPLRPQSSFWHTRSFPRFVAAFHSRLRKFRFFFLGFVAESRCNDFNLERSALRAQSVVVALSKLTSFPSLSALCSV